MTDLAAALHRLANFRAHWNDDDLIDEPSGLTVKDLDIIIAMGATQNVDIAGEPIPEKARVSVFIIAGEDPMRRPHA